MEEDLESDLDDLDIDSSGEIVYAMWYHLYGFGYKNVIKGLRRKKNKVSCLLLRLAQLRLNGHTLNLWYVKDWNNWWVFLNKNWKEKKKTFHQSVIYLLFLACFMFLDFSNNWSSLSKIKSILEIFRKLNFFAI